MFKFKCKGTTIISFLQSLFVMIFGFCDLRPKVKGFLRSKAPKYVQQFPRWDKCPTSLSYNHTKTTGIMIDYYNDKTLTCRPSTRIAPSCFSSFRHRCNEYFWIPKWQKNIFRLLKPDLLLEIKDHLFSYTHGEHVNFLGQMRNNI